MNKAKLLLAAALVAGSTFAANAADIQQPQLRLYQPIQTVYNWTGFHVGVHGGYALVDETHMEDSNGGIYDPLKLSHSWHAGAQIGLDWQIGYLVVGLENSTSYKGGVYSLTQVSCDPSICGPGFNYTNSVKTPWLNTTMARLGVTVTDRFLVYLTGGLAVTQLQIENVSNFGPGSSLSTKETRWAVGYAAGLGVEYAFAGNWSAKLEGIYSDLGSQRFQYASADPTFGKFNSWTSDGLKEIFLRTAINYRF